MSNSASGYTSNLQLDTGQNGESVELETSLRVYLQRSKARGKVDWSNNVGEQRRSNGSVYMILECRGREV